MCLFWLCATAALGLVHAGGPGSFFLPGHHDFMESSSAARLAKHYSGFVHKYAPELRAEFDAAREFKNATRTCRGEIGSVEASMLYVMIREFRPRRVLEVGALYGSSTRWLLAALKANGDGGTLTTFDLSSSAQRFVQVKCCADDRPAGGFLVEVDAMVRLARAGRRRAVASSPA